MLELAHFFIQRRLLAIRMGKHRQFWVEFESITWAPSRSSTSWKLWEIRSMRKIQSSSKKNHCPLNWRSVRVIEIFPHLDDAVGQLGSKQCASSNLSTRTYFACSIGETSIRILHFQTRIGVICSMFTTLDSSSPWVQCGHPAFGMILVRTIVLTRFQLVELNAFRISKRITV